MRDLDDGNKMNKSILTKYSQNNIAIHAFDILQFCCSDESEPEYYENDPELNVCLQNADTCIHLSKY